VLKNVINVPATTIIFKFFSRTAVATLLFLAAGQHLQAGLISGSEEISFASRPLLAAADGSANLTSATQIRVFNVQDNGGSGIANTGYFQDVPLTTSLSSATSSSPLVIQFKNGASNFTFGNSNWGWFTATSQTDTIGVKSRTEHFTGTFTPANPFFGNSSLSSNTADILFTFNQTGGAGTAVSGSATLDSPAAASVPEPATMTMVSMALGLFGLVGGFRRNRRRKSRFLGSHAAAE
jgi:PEP-CTERM motif